MSKAKDHKIGALADTIYCLFLAASFATSMVFIFFNYFAYRDVINIGYSYDYQNFAPSQAKVYSLLWVVFSACLLLLGIDLAYERKKKDAVAVCCIIFASIWACQILYDFLSITPWP